MTSILATLYPEKNGIFPGNDVFPGNSTIPAQFYMLDYVAATRMVSR